MNCQEPNGILHPYPELFKVMESLRSPSPPIEVWIDGDCAVCRRSEQWCSARDPQGRLSFVDLHTARYEDLPGSPDAMMETIHVRLPDGTVVTGFDAWRQILIELDGWRWLARLTALPGIRRLGSVLYSTLARYRHRVSVT